MARAAIAASLFGLMPLYLALFDSALVLGSALLSAPRGVCCLFYVW